MRHELGEASSHGPVAPGVHAAPGTHIPPPVVTPPSSPFAPPSAPGQGPHAYVPSAPHVHSSHEPGDPLAHMPEPAWHFAPWAHTPGPVVDASAPPLEPVQAEQ